MQALLCVEGRDWEGVVKGAARYLREGEAVLASVVDERAPRGYDLALRGLLGRRGRGDGERMASLSERAAEDLLADAETLLRRLHPELGIRTVTLHGPPGEELARIAGEGTMDVVFIGRGAPGSRACVRVSGVVRGWKHNRHGDPDGLLLENGTEVRFPPHRAREVQRVAREGAMVEVFGERRGEHLHAYTIANPTSGEAVEAHEVPPRGEPAKAHLGHTARYVVDHVACDVVVLRL